MLEQGRRGCVESDMHAALLNIVRCLLPHKVRSAVMCSSRPTLSLPLSSGDTSTCCPWANADCHALGCGAGDASQDGGLNIFSNNLMNQVLREPLFICHEATKIMKPVL